MGVEDDKKTVQLVEEAYNRGDLDSLDRHLELNDIYSLGMQLGVIEPPKM